MNKLVKFYDRPQLNNPNLIAAWPGIGNVSLLVATYLAKKLDFKKLGEIDASYFFDPVGIVVKDNIVEAPKFPQSRFYYYQNKGGGSDIILFIGEDQPVTSGYDLASCVLDVGLNFQMKRVYTCAAAPTHIHPSEQPSVWSVSTSTRLRDELKAHDLLQRGNMHISGLNGLLLGVAKERNVDGICLLGEVPMYASKIQNPATAMAILKVLTKMLGIKIDTGELAREARETTSQLKQLAAEAMGEYIDTFTEPIWEHEDEEEEE